MGGLLLLAVAGAALSRPRLRTGAALFSSAAVVIMLLPLATFWFAPRYAIPAFGPLAAAAGFGGLAVQERLRPLLRRVHTDG
jgi:hypothetical protein